MVRRVFWKFVGLCTRWIARAAHWVTNRAVTLELLAFIRVAELEFRQKYPVATLTRDEAQENLSKGCLETVDPGLMALARNYVESDPLYGKIPAAPKRKIEYDDVTKNSRRSVFAHAEDNGLPIEEITPGVVDRLVDDAARVWADDVDIGLNRSIMNHDDGDLPPSPDEVRTAKEELLTEYRALPLYDLRVHYGACRDALSEALAKEGLAIKIVNDDK